MVRVAVIVRYSEIALKGKNRPQFERQLVQNIRKGMQKHRTRCRIETVRGRVYLHGCRRCAWLSRIFGVVSYSYAVLAGPDQESLEKCADRVLGKKKFETFRVSARRIDKTWPVSSMQINTLLGRHIAEKFGRRVSLRSQDLDIGVEICEGRAFVFTETVPGPGGLPLGVNGTASVLMESEESALAGLLLMRRGLFVYPYGTADISLLRKFAYGQQIRLHAKDAGTTPAVVTSRPLGRLNSDKLVLAPLVGLTKAEIAEKILYYKCL